MEIFTANEAAKITENARKTVSAWEKLFDKIKETAENGQNLVVFDEERENIRFKENRKEVKQKLLELGYACNYRRVKDTDNYYGDNFHSFYTIAWPTKAKETDFT